MYIAIELKNKEAYENLRRYCMSNGIDFMGFTNMETAEQGNGVNGSIYLFSAEDRPTIVDIDEGDSDDK